jgi:hypothetical protein
MHLLHSTRRQLLLSFTIVPFTSAETVKELMKEPRTEQSIVTLDDLGTD